MGTLVGVLALMNSVTSTTENLRNELHYDLDLNTVVGKQLDADADRLNPNDPRRRGRAAGAYEYGESRRQGRLDLGTLAAAHVRAEGRLGTMVHRP